MPTSSELLNKNGKARLFSRMTGTGISTRENTLNSNRKLKM